VTGRTIDTLFEGRYVPSTLDQSHQQYDAHPDGKRLLVLRPATEEAELVVVLNALAELRARTGAAAR
jgi:hypothetical protein